MDIIDFFSAEVLDAARNDIINALVNQLTSVMNEEEQNELSNFPLVDAKRLDNGQEVNFFLVLDLISITGHRGVTLKIRIY